MRIPFDPASPARLRRFGLGLPFTRPTTFTAEFALEAPVEILAEIDTAMPCRIGAFTTIAGGRLRHVAIGRYCTLAADVQTGWEPPSQGWATTSALAHAPNPHGWATLLGHDPRPPAEPPATRQATTIGNDVWIGQGAYLHPGITIGDGAIIAPRAVVEADVPPFAVMAGTPARLQRLRFDDATIARLRALAWWRFSLLQLPPGLPQDVPRFLDHLDHAIARGAIEPYEPGWQGPADLMDLVVHQG
jgi:acetyltransferase-like isoleucine patch superfamily enzyme